MEQTTCIICDHSHQGSDGSCECGCAIGTACAQCAHTHGEPDGSCVCGCAAA